MQAFLKYPGSKWSRASWIISHFPPHSCYVEPYAGSAACYFSKPPSAHSVLNDLSGDIVNLFRVIREQGEALAALLEMTPWARREYEGSGERSGDALEDARRFLVRGFQAHGARLHGWSGWSRGGPSHRSFVGRWQQVPERILAVVARLKEAEIECRPALELIGDPNYCHPDVLFYVDPPYVLSTRHERYYQHEMSDGDHLRLLEVVESHPGFIVLSGYSHPLYEERLRSWGRATMPTPTESGQSKLEVLWFNQRVLRALAGRQLSLFEEVP